VDTSANAAANGDPANHGRRTLGIVLAGAGIAAAGVGAYFGLHALSLQSERQSLCPSNICPPHGVDLNDDAHTSARVADVAFGVGILGVATGAYFFFTRASSGGPTSARAVRIVPSAGARSAGISVGASF
jgi:hypothetical protein